MKQKTHLTLLIVEGKENRRNKKSLKMLTFCTPTIGMIIRDMILLYERYYYIRLGSIHIGKIFFDIGTYVRLFNYDATRPIYLIILKDSLL